MPAAAPPTRFALVIAAAFGIQGGAAAQEWVPLDVEVRSSVAATFETLDDGSTLVRSDAELERYSIEADTEIEGIRAIRIEVLPHDSLPKKGPGRGANGNFVLSEVSATTTVSRRSHAVRIARATASYGQLGWPAAAAIDGRPGTGWAVGGDGAGQPAELILVLDQPLGKGRRRVGLDLEFLFGEMHSIGRFRVSVTTHEGRISPEKDARLSEAQLAVNGAIDRGVDYLLGQQLLDGSFANDQDHYPSGTTALVCYALLKSGVPGGHPAVRRALGFMEAHPPTKTYEAGCHLLALSALDHASVRDRAQAILDDLVDWQMGSWGYPGSHGDPSAGHRDLSNTQYAALGLWSAVKMGLEVPTPVWNRLASATMEYQAGRGRGTGQAGFGYTPGRAPTGAMTAAGVAVLAICLPHLDGADERRARSGFRLGLAWLDANFTPTKNPGGGGWLDYYLYGVERVGALAEVDRLNGQDWYLEGSRQLIKSQKGPGNWADGNRPESTTCYAVLFLNKATAPSSGPGVGRSGPIYGADDPEAEFSLRASGDTPLAVWVSSFGDAILEELSFEGEKAPRVLRVEYLTPGGALLADEHGVVDWAYTSQAPEGAWTQVAFDDSGWKRGRSAFGRLDSPQLTVRTEWTAEDIYLRKSFVVDRTRLVEPRLELSFSAREPVRSTTPTGALVKLFDEEEAFLDLLPGGQAGTRMAHEAGAASSGDRAVLVTPRLRENSSIRGWRFPIREKPKAGEYRYVQFAWRKPTGGVMVQFAMDAAWGQVPRYFAGPNKIGFEPAIQVSRDPPAEWTVVTRDLWKDHGKDALLTGISFTPMDGDGWFDAVYLARSRKDFRRIPKAVGELPEWAPASWKEREVGDDPGALRLYLNGEEVLTLGRETEGHEVVLEGDDLVSLLRDGTNVVAVRARNSELGRALDVGLVDFDRLAVVHGDVREPAKAGQRFAARFSFPRPGAYEILARVHVVDPTDRSVFVLEGAPLRVDITEAVWMEHLAYATDSTRNVLAQGRVQARASTELPGWPAANAVDNTQFRAWLSADGDPNPTLTLELDRPMRATSLLLSHTRADRADGARTTVPRRVEVILNRKEDPFVIEVDPDRNVKTVLEFGSTVRVRRIDLRVLDSTEGHPVKNAVGFAEVELQLDDAAKPR